MTTTEMAARLEISPTHRGNAPRATFAQAQLHGQTRADYYAMQRGIVGSEAESASRTARRTFFIRRGSYEWIMGESNGGSVELRIE